MGMLATATHVYFFQGDTPFSNWYRGQPFSGEIAFREMIARLDALGVAHPSEKALSSRLLRTSTFFCGEQWMMAAKCWIMDRSPLMLDETIYPSRKVMMDALGNHLYQTPLAQVLRTRDPREQKAIGRSLQYYNEQLWGAARVACVTAGTIARIDADPVVRKAFLDVGDREFVEGSPFDRIWGVGLRYDDPRILDPRQWRGRNLLGESHRAAIEAWVTQNTPAF